MNKILNKITISLFGWFIGIFVLMPGSIGVSIFSSHLPPKILFTLISCALIFLSLLVYYLPLKSNCSFKLNLMFGTFVVYLFINLLFYVLRNPQQLHDGYTLVSIGRLCIFFFILVSCNLCLSINDKDTLIKSLVSFCWIMGLIGILFMLYPQLQKFTLDINGRMVSPFSYTIQTKYPIALCFISYILLARGKSFQKDFHRYSLALLALLLVLCVLAFSFQGKRSGLFMGLFSMVVFIFSSSINCIKNNNKRFLPLLIIVLVLVLALVWKVNSFHSYSNSLFQDRIALNKSYLPLIQASSHHLITGLGHGNPIVDYTHNVSLDLLLSSGIVGLFLWYTPFLYLLWLWKKQKAKNLYIFLLFSYLGLLFLNTFATGFYPYFVHMYILMYYIEYHLKGIRKETDRN